MTTGAKALSPLIEQIEHDDHAHFVVFISDGGIHWRGESEEACEVMAKVIGNCRVLTKSALLATLKTVQEDGA